MLSFSVSCKKFSDTDIKFGIIGPMQLSQGNYQWNGATLAAEEINAAGGIKVGAERKKIELIKADSNELTSIPDAVNAMERLITQENADFILGGFRTEAVLAMQDIAMDHKKIFIGVGAAHPELCLRVAKDYNKYKYFFRGAPVNSKFLGKTMFIHLGSVAEILKKELKIPKIKVAVVAEKALWADAIVDASKKTIPKMGLELSGIWRPAAQAADVSPEISAIQRKGAHIAFTIFSSAVGLTFVKQIAELKAPIVLVGNNTEAQKKGFWDATQGKCNYVMSQSTFAQIGYQNELTKPFIEKYIARFNEIPSYTADTYSYVKILAQCIEKAGSTDAEKIIPLLENEEFNTVTGKVKYMKDEKENPLHELTWGPGYIITSGAQWQDGKFTSVWPNKWKLDKDSPEITFIDVGQYKIPPVMIEKYKK
ncbi:MAG: ABC transporter substrate-binding protein [Spirochaetes bacterium RBG_16_49_21]|nr:MAG: ABC transporter substrate-binding protein [Spirochaetes bacterium RBG_16_49_21]